ncbi:MAG: hypothetical protein KDB80_14735 [Planctomycetes bacterium]|nr:hypothetical protein [Planctomycetota bacterium]
MLKLDLNPPVSQLRQFGTIALFGFPLVGFMISWKFLEDPMHPTFWVLLAVGVVTFVLSKIDAKLIKPIFVGLMVVALPIGLVISFVLMGLIYYGMVTPIGVLFRLFGRDPLNKTPDPDAKSYWHVRTKQPSPASYLKQY